MNRPSPVTKQSFRDWTPIHIFRHSPEPLVLWSRLGVDRFDAPFFEQSVSHALRRPLATLLQRTTSIGEMIEIGESGPALEPTGIIFHVARCGSTLVSRSFAHLPRFLVISEAQPLEAVLSETRLTEFERQRAFQALVRLYGRARNGESSYLIKMEPRHLLYWQSIVELYPSVPRVVAYREPVEVLVSIMRSMPEAMMPGSIDLARLGTPPQALRDNEDYAAFVVARLFAAAAELAKMPQSLALNYRDLPDAVSQRVVPHFGVTISEAERAELTSISRWQAKDPTRQVEFVPDSVAKQAAANQRIRLFARGWCGPSFAALEAMANELRPS